MKSFEAMFTCLHFRGYVTFLYVSNEQREHKLYVQAVLHGVHIPVLFSRKEWRCYWFFAVSLSVSTFLSLWHALRPWTGPAVRTYGGCARFLAMCCYKSAGGPWFRQPFHSSVTGCAWTPKISKEESARGHYQESLILMLICANITLFFFGIFLS